MFTTIIDAKARSGSPSQLIRPLIRPTCQSSQFSTLKVGSNIHFQANVDSTVGMMNGSRMKARTQALPLKCRFSNCASQSPNTSLNIVVTNVYQQVFHTAVRKIASFQTFSKFFSPTKWPGTPTRVSVRASQMPSKNG